MQQDLCHRRSLVTLRCQLSLSERRQPSVLKQKRIRDVFLRVFLVREKQVK